MNTWTVSSAEADEQAAGSGEPAVVRTPDDPADWEAIRQRGIKRFTLTLPGHAAVLAILAIAAWLGVVHPAVAGLIAVLIGCALPVFYGLLRSGVMVRSSDPLLAFAQVLFSIFMVALGYALFDGLRSTVLLWLSVIIVYDMRRLPLRQVRAAACFCVAVLLLATAARAAWHPSGLDWVHELFTALLLAVVLPVLIAVSAQARAVRRRHLQQKEQMARTLAQLRQLAVRDKLTGLFNRRHMLDTLESEVRRSARTGQPFWVAIVDLDLFKQINDRFGHATGDYVLQTFGRLAQAAVPGLADLCARWGGEEFLVLQTGCSEDEALDGLQRLHQAVRDHAWARHAPGLSVSFSAGLCEHLPGGALDHTLEQADRALYQAKAAGRNRIVTASGHAVPGCATRSTPPLPTTAVEAASGVEVESATESTIDPMTEPTPPAARRAQPLLDILFGRHTRLRTSQYLCLLSAGVYLACVAGFLLYVVPAGLLTRQQAGFFVAHNALAAVLPSTLLRLGVTARWRDPGLVLPQVIWGGLGGIIGYGMMPSTSPSTLQLICLSLVFGFSSLRPQQVRVVGALYIVTLLAVLATRASLRPAHFNPVIEGLEVAMTCLVLWLLTLLSLDFSLSRERVRADKRQLAEATEQVNRLMMHDALTGLVNRHRMQDLLAREGERQQRSGSPWCVALIDLDYFKRINDTHGHRMGDEVLIGFARCAQSVLRETDVIGRWGGEEFLVLLADTEPGLQALQALDRLRDAVDRQRFIAGTATVAITFSAGLAEHRPGEAVALTLERADRALYDAKRAGRNRCVMGA